jgi:hypothetical protein
VQRQINAPLVGRESFAPLDELDNAGLDGWPMAVRIGVKVGARYIVSSGAGIGGRGRAAD